MQDSVHLGLIFLLQSFGRSELALSSPQPPSTLSRRHAAVAVQIAVRKSVVLRTPRPATEPRDGPTRNFHEKYQRKYPPRPKFWNPKKIPPKYRENTKNNHFWCFQRIFLRYFQGILGVNSGSPEFRAGGYFFGIFRGNSGRAI